MLYEYVGFDKSRNVELWRRCSWLRLHLMWLRDRLAGDRAARIDYKVWLYVQVRGGGLAMGEWLDWGQEVVK